MPKKRLAARPIKAMAAPKPPAAAPAIMVIKVSAGIWAERPVTAARSPATTAQVTAVSVAAVKKMSLARTFPPSVGELLLS